MGYSTYTPFHAAAPHHSSLQFHPYPRPQPPPGPVLPPIDFRRAFYPPSRSVSAESNSHSHGRKRIHSTSATPPLLEAILEPLPSPRYEVGRYPEVKRERLERADDIFFSRRPSLRMSTSDPSAALALHFAMQNGGRDAEGLSSVRSSNEHDIPVIPPEIRFDETLNSSADSPLDDPNGLMDDGTPRQPFSRSPELRVTHKLAERKRRKEMKDLFDELREHLPPERGIKSSKWEILSKSIDYVTFLKKQNADAAAEIDRLRRELDIARGGTGQYTPYTFSLPMAYPAPGTYAAAPPTAQPAQPQAAQVPQQPPAATSLPKPE